MYLLDYLTNEWSILIESNALILLFIAAFCGALIGLEREAAEKPAGLRTNMLVCLGSCLLTIASIFSWQYVANSSPTVDPNRITAQIVSGIGFLGAALVLRTKTNSVIGITTAATIWITASIGIIIGVGFPLLGVITTLGVVLILTTLGIVERKYINK